jgi:hypothetical protein
MDRRTTLKQHLDGAELLLQRAQRRLDIQREAVAALERAGQDSAKAKIVLELLEKALAFHIADRDGLAKRRPRTPHQLPKAALSDDPSGDAY